MKSVELIADGVYNDTTQVEKVETPNQCEKGTAICVQIDKGTGEFSIYNLQVEHTKAIYCICRKRHGVQMAYNKWLISAKSYCRYFS